MKGKYKIAVFAVILIILVSSFLVANRYYYGSFNVFSQPVRLVYGGMHYNHRSFVTLQTDQKTIEISRIIDKFTGKKLFSTTLDFIGPGKTIYLQLSGDKYISYSSGGGG